MEEKWAVILWGYGYHCDEFIVHEVKGPFSFEEATEIEINLETEYYVQVAPMKGNKDEGKDEVKDNHDEGAHLSKSLCL